MNLRCLLALVAGLIAIPALADTYGKQEHVRVMGTGVEVTAALSPAVERSALRAFDVKYFQREGDTWVRFTIDNGSVLPGNRVTLERKVLKDVKVRQSGGGVEHRPLVEIELCLGDRSFKSTLSVSDRTSYTAPLMIGGADLQLLGAVDTARQFTHEPSCKVEGPVQPLDEKAVTPRVVELKPGAGSAPTAGSSLLASSEPGPASAYQCDGRTRCTQMHSCAEAKYFISHCPGTKMDGDNDGIPCEEQWCQ